MCRTGSQKVDITALWNYKLFTSGMETTGIQEEEMFVQKEKLQCRNVHFFTILKTNHIITVLL